MLLPEGSVYRLKYLTGALKVCFNLSKDEKMLDAKFRRIICFAIIFIKRFQKLL